MMILIITVVKVKTEIGNENTDLGTQELQMSHPLYDVVIIRKT